MALREWHPPRWLVWYGYAWAIAWGYPAQLPPRAARAGGLERFLDADLDAALVRLLAEEHGR